MSAFHASRSLGIPVRCPMEAPRSRSMRNRNSVYKRFARWADRGTWELWHQHLAGDPDMEYLIIDSTVVRAHPCARRGITKKAAKRLRLLGRSRGGFSTKLHVTVDGLGNPLRFILTGGQEHDFTHGRGADSRLWRWIRHFTTRDMIPSGSVSRSWTGK